MKQFLNIHNEVAKLSLIKNVYLANSDVILIFLSDCVMMVMILSVLIDINQTFVCPLIF